METSRLKESLLQISEKVEEDTTVEDIFKQFSYFIDIEESEEQERKGQVKTQKEVEKISKEWLK